MRLSHPLPRVKNDVTVNNTGTLELTFTDGSSSFTLQPGSTKGISTGTWSVKSGENVIATITYPDKHEWKVVSGSNVSGAKFTSRVPMDDN